MDFKKIYSKAKGAYDIVMMAVDFYQTHKEEIKPIASKAKTLALSVKDGWNNWWGIESKKEIGNDTTLLQNINVNYGEVVDWISDKDILEPKDVESRFNLNPIESLLVLRQLEDNNLVEKLKDKVATFKVVVDACKA